MGGLLETHFTRDANNVGAAWKYQRVKYALEQVTRC